MVKYMIRKTFYRFILILFIAFSGVSYSQQEANGQKSSVRPDQEKMNLILDDESLEARKLLGDTLSRSLYKVVINTFEQAGEWYSLMPNDLGYVVSRRQLGSPLFLLNQGAPQKIQVPPGQVSKVQGQDVVTKNPPKFRKQDGKYQSSYYLPYEDKKQYILGVKASFNKRGSGWFGVYPYRSIYLDGLVKSLEVWVVGRQKNHRLYAIVQDIYGKDKIILMGRLNFLGWKRLHVNVPSFIKQYDYHFSSKRGLVFKGFLIKTEPTEAQGDYYIYFDNFSAEVSRFWEEYQDQKDPMDVW